MSFEIPTPQALFRARLDHLQAARGGPPLPIREISAAIKIPGLGKDVIYAILSGETGRKDSAYINLAKNLSMDASFVEACLAWHRLSDEARGHITNLVKQHVVSISNTRDRIDPCLHWVDADLHPDKSIMGCTLLKGQLHFLFLYLEELSPDDLDEIAAKHQATVGLIRTVFLVMPQSWSKDRLRNYQNSIGRFGNLSLAKSLDAALSSSASSKVVVTEDDLLNWIFLLRFNPKNYVLDQLSEHPESFDLTRASVDLHFLIGGTEQPTNALDALQAWCVDHTHREQILTLEGGYGTGKTTLLEQLELRLLRRFKKTTLDDDDRAIRSLQLIPLRIAFTPASLPTDISSLYGLLVKQFFAGPHSFGMQAFNPDFPVEIFRLLCNSHRRFVLLVDSLDEVVRSATALDSVLGALSDFAALGNRVVVATRPEIFIDQQEIQKQLTHRNAARAEILPVTKEAVQQFIDDTILDPKDRKLIDRLRQDPRSDSVFARPIFLRFLCDQVIIKHRNLERLFNPEESYQLFYMLTDEWLHRERFRTAEFQTRIEEFLKEMAIELSLHPHGEVTDAQMPLAIQSSLDEITTTLQGKKVPRLSVFATRGEETEQIEREARICSFVNVQERKGERVYSFTLRPFASFFLAEAVVQELKKSDWKPETSRIGRMRLQPSDIDLVTSGLRPLDIADIKNKLVRAIGATSRTALNRLWPFTYLGGNAASIYTRLNNNVFDLDLQGISLTGVHLINAKVVGNWFAVDLSDSTLAECEFTELQSKDLYAANTFITQFNDHWPRVLSGKISRPEGLVELKRGEVTTQWTDLGALAGYTFIPPGEFQFGLRFANPNRAAFVHGFFMKTTQVTKKEFNAFLQNSPFWKPENHEEALKEIERRLLSIGAELGSTQHYLKGFDEGSEEEPVVYLPEIVMREYCQAINGRLPSESEWEYAYWCGSERGRWKWDGPAHSRIRAVTDQISQLQNGLIGMADNVSEMCADCYWRKLGDAIDLVGPGDPIVNPFSRPFTISAKRPGGPVTPKDGVLRGPSFANHDVTEPAEARRSYHLGNMDNDVGFRPVIDMCAGVARIRNVEPRAVVRKV